MSYLIDTCVISEYVRKKPNSAVLDWFSDQKEQDLHLSAITMAELKKGYCKLKARDSRQANQRKAQKLTKWIKTVEERFRHRMLPVNDPVLEVWARLCGESEVVGKPLPGLDSLIIASAIAFNLTIVTRNDHDFIGVSDAVNLLNPFER